jgi:hypothetical protein
MGVFFRLYAHLIRGPSLPENRVPFCRCRCFVLLAMSSSRLPLAATLVCIAAIGVGWLLEHRSHARLQREYADLSARLAATDEALAKSRPDPEAVAADNRAREALQAEVLRLRGDVANLRRNQATQKKAPIPANAPPPNPTPPTATAEAPGTGPGWMVSRVPLNGGALFPAWTSADGKQAWVLAIPSVAQPDINSGNVMLEQMIFEGSPEALASLGIGSTPAGGAAGSAPLDPEGSKALLERLRKTDGIDVLSAPRIITGGGNEAQVSIGNDTRGHLNLSVIPNLAPDGNVDLRLKVSRSEGTGQP